MKIEFWFDFASTYSYPTVLRIESLTCNHNIQVLWRPFLLGPIFKKQGWNDSPFNIYQSKGEYMWRDLKRVCDDLQIPFNRPEKFPQNGLLAARIVTAFSDAPWVPGFIRSVYSANFEYNKNISSSEIIADCLKCSAENVDSIIYQANQQESKDKLRKRTNQAYEKGIFGAPSFLVGKELFWGNDRLERAIKWAIDEKV